MGIGPRISTASYYENPIVRTIERIVEKVVFKNGNPNPAKYKILAFEKIGRYLIVWIRYPDCLNFEGHKILVYEDVDLSDLHKQKLIDPHFLDDPKYHSPVARFVPNDKGWKMAVKFVETMGASK